MATRKKATAPAVPVPQTRDECAAEIHKMGDSQRELLRQSAEMNDRIAAVTSEFQPSIDKLTQAVKDSLLAVQAWCEAHRVELTEDGKRKTVNLVTGTVAWRMRPPAVKIVDVDAVLRTLRMLELTRYIRPKDEVNKEAILAAWQAAANAPTTDPKRAELIEEAERIAGVAGIKVMTGIEDFSVEPTEVDVEAAS